jgi:hypothetical protein
VKLEMLLSIGVAVFYVVVGAIYVASGGEAAGITLLFLSAAVGGLIAGWTWDWRRRHRDRLPRPEDVPRADTPDAAGLVGVYPTASLRPLAVAVGLCAVALGIVLGSWMLVGGAAIVASQVALLVRDADR